MTTFECANVAFCLCIARDGRDLFVQSFRFCKTIGLTFCIFCLPLASYVTIIFVFLFGAGTNSGAHNESSCSSGPDSPHTKELEHLDGTTTPARAQYLSATCVVFTHYTGDTASVVDEHFSRALNFSNKDSKGECQQ